MTLTEEERRLLANADHPQIPPMSYLPFTDALESIVASRERAAAEKAWDERNRVEHAEWCFSGDPKFGRTCPADNPYRAGEIRNGN